MTHARYRETLDHLYGLRRFGMRPGLEVITALLGEMGHPERTFRALHVTGSKGKGSVSALAAAALGSRGRSVGLFTSPHLQRYEERIRIGSTPIPGEAVVDGVDRIAAISQRLQKGGRIDREPTFFEVTTALAFDWFRIQKVPWAVVEVGLGGRLDSTNVLDAPVGVITTIELEHTDVLGPTLADVAREKAGILHPGMRGIVGLLPPEAMTVVERHATSTGVPLWHLEREIRLGARTLSPSGQRFSIATPGRTLAKVDLPLLGRFQATNAALAVGAVDAFLSAVSVSIDDAHVVRALKGTRWRGRLERVAKRPDLYLDVAHTPESAHAIAESLAEISPFEDPGENVLLFSCLQGKRTEEILDRLSPLASTIVLVPVASDRALGLASLRLAALGRFPRIVQAPDVASGLQLARAATSPGGFTLAAGSDYLVGELLNALEGSPVDQPDLADPASPPHAAKRAAGPR